MSVSDTDWQLLSARVAKLEDANKKQRWRFVKDDDGHNFLIPDGMREEFYHELANGDDDCWANFCNKFESYSIDSVGNYTFENPQ